jgi:hypothetical protein
VLKELQTLLTYHGEVIREWVDEDPKIAETALRLARVLDRVYGLSEGEGGEEAEPQ